MFFSSHLLVCVLRYMFASFHLLVCIFPLACRNPRYLYSLTISESIILPALVGMLSAGSNIPMCTTTLVHLLITNFMPMSLLKISKVLTIAVKSFSDYAFTLTSSIYSKWLILCPYYNVCHNAVWFIVVLRGFSATQKWNRILRLLGIFHTLMECLLSVFHMLLVEYSIGSVSSS